MRECHICGHYLPLGVNECSRCGNRLTKERETQVTQNQLTNVHYQSSKVTQNKQINKMQDLISNEEKVKEMTRQQNKVALIAVIVSIFIILMMIR